MGVDGTHGTRGFYWSLDSYFLIFAIVYCTK